MSKVCALFSVNFPLQCNFHSCRKLDAKPVPRNKIPTVVQILQIRYYRMLYLRFPSDVVNKFLAVCFLETHRLFIPSPKLTTCYRHPFKRSQAFHNGQRRQNGGQSYNNNGNRCRTERFYLLSAVFGNLAMFVDLKCTLTKRSRRDDESYSRCQFRIWN